MYQGSGDIPNWWQVKGDPHEALFSLLAVLDERQLYRRDDLLTYLRLYGNSEIDSFTSTGYSSIQRRNRKNRVTLNIVQSITDTMVARISRQQPKAKFLTSGGNWSQQRKARLLEKFVEGQFYESNIYKEGTKVFLDACVTGTGVLKIFEHDKCIRAERVFPSEITVNNDEAIYGCPRQLFQRKYIDRHALCAMYPDHRDHIMSLSAEDGMPHRSGVYETDFVVVSEGWRLPSHVDADDGRHVIAVSNATLLDEPYKRDYFPFVFLHWSSRLLGFWGQGIAEQLMGIQYEINKILLEIQEQMHLATPKVLVETGSKISKATINNRIWGLIEYSGTKPDFYVPRVVSGEIFAHLDRLVMRAYEIVGVSTLSAQSKKPAGLDSGIALREFHDIETERFYVVSKNYEDMFLTAAKHFVDLAKEIDARGDEYKILSHGDKEIEEIRWKDVDLEKSKYVMKIYPTNLLPTTPSGRLQTVQEMMVSGLIGRDEALSLLDYPDIESIGEIQNAPIDDVKMLVTAMLEKGEYHAPEPFMDLAMAIKMVTGAYLRAKIENAPEDRLDLLRRFIEQATDMKQEAEAATMYAMQAAQTPPMPPTASEPPPDMGQVLQLSQAAGT